MPIYRTQTLDLDGIDFADNCHIGGFKRSGLLKGHFERDECEICHRYERYLY